MKTFKNSRVWASVVIYLAAEVCAGSGNISSSSDVDNLLRRDLSPNQLPIKSGYVAFGDSYAAGLGTGTTSWASWWEGCRLGSNNYPNFLYEYIHNKDVRYLPLQCSGDTTVGLARQVDVWKTKDPSKFDLATITMGGNDLKFSELLRYCIISFAYPWESEEDRRKKCEDLEKDAINKLMDSSKDGLRYKLTHEYKRILDFSGRDDFHIYVTGYPTFFNEEDADCDLTTFSFWGPKYKPNKTPGDKIIMLTRNLRSEVNRLVRLLNAAIERAVQDANRQAGRERVYFVDIDSRFTSHRFCEPGPSHEPDENRNDNYFFLSGWHDIGRGQMVVSRQSYIDAEAQYFKSMGGPKLPDASTCKAQLGRDPDPYKEWACVFAEIVAADPNGEAARAFENVKTAWASGDIHAEHVSLGWLTSDIQTFHPRSTGMEVYAGSIIFAIRDHQTKEGRACPRFNPLPKHLDSIPDADPDHRNDLFVAQGPANGGPGKGSSGGSNGDPSRGFGGQQQIALASYIYPNGEGLKDWERMIGYDNRKVSILVANVLNGPDTEVKPGWDHVLSLAAQKRKTVLGYVRTGYLGLSPSDPGPFEPFVTRLGSGDVADWIAQIEQDIDGWYSLYGAKKIGGIFLDEGYNECTKDGHNAADIYRFITENTKRKYPGALIVLNPGTGVPQCYEDSADTLLTFESSWHNYKIRNYTAITWTPKDTRKIWHIVYDVPEGDAKRAAALASRNNAGYVHITNDQMPNPYDTLPSSSYMQNVMDFVSGGSPLVLEPPPQSKGGHSPSQPTLSLSDKDYTSATLKWDYPGSDPYGFIIYAANKQYTLPGSFRHVTIGGFASGSDTPISMRALGPDGAVSSPSSTFSVRTTALSGAAISNVTAEILSPSQTVYRATVVAPAGFVRIFISDADTSTNWPAWPLAWPPSRGISGFVTTHYMIEGRTLYKYTGSKDPVGDNNREWSWTPVDKMDNVKVVRDRYSYTWTVPFDFSAHDMDARYAVVQTEGYGQQSNHFLPCPSNMLAGDFKGTSYACTGAPPYDCQGARPMCTTTIGLGDLCRRAAEGLNRTQVYTANEPMGKSGNCFKDSVNMACKIFVQGQADGKYCSMTGEDMIQAYEQIGTVGGCKRCGTKHFPNRCMVTRDYSYGCDIPHEYDGPNT